MYKIKDVEISGFWGQHKIEAEFHEDINIFIGKNGTGKTTFMKLLEAILTMDLTNLYSLQFEKIALRLIKGKSTRKVEVTKSVKGLEYEGLTYQISSNIYKFPIIPDFEYRDRSGRLPPRFYREVEEVKNKLQALINISFLSVHREDVFEDDEYVNRRRKPVNPIEVKLSKLMRDFTTYQLQIETQISSLSNSFQENVLRTMLFDEEFDYVDINESIDLSDERVEEIKAGLLNVYRDLGILDKKIKDKINAHVNAIRKASTSINKHIQDRETAIYPNDVTPLTLLRRTWKIIEFSTDLEKKKEEVLKPINQYLELLTEFVEEKTFSTSTRRGGGLQVFRNNQNFPLSKLSSGEKQLIILLTESLLQKSQDTIFIADEPELSLHISWQRKIIPSLTKINPNAQIIVATHSPEIVGKKSDKAINMLNIIHE